MCVFISVCVHVCAFLFNLGGILRIHVFRLALSSRLWAACGSMCICFRNPVPCTSKAPVTHKNDILSLGMGMYFSNLQNI